MADTVRLVDDRSVVLTGFMGTGKSTVGRMLAERLGFEHVDTDRMIEQRHGPITSIFAEQGDDGFRRIERSVADELAGRRGLVISTGGRLLVDPVNADRLEDGARVFCLTASPSTILARVSAETSLVERPLLAGPDVGGRVTELLAERADAYARFEQVDTDHRTPADVVDHLVELLLNDRRAAERSVDPGTR